VEVVVVVLALGVGALLMWKGSKRDESSPPKRELSLARQDDGTWAPSPPRADDSTLTVTLVVPWDEVGDRYSGLNVVVK
jgi:hypothetical protein